MNLNEVWKLRLRLSPVERLVLVYLVDRANRDGVCWPSLSTIAEDLEVNRRSVVRALQALRARGLVTWESRGVNHYQVTIPTSGTMPLGSGITPLGVVASRHQGSGTMPLGSGITPPPSEPPIEPPIRTSSSSTVTATTVGQPGEPEARQREEGQVGKPKTQEPTSISRGLDYSSGQTILAAAAEPAPDSAPRPAAKERVQAHLPGPRPTGFPYSPERGALVRELREAGLWERFNGLLRRHARDERAWWAWLDRLAPERQRLNGRFAEAVRAALDRLEAWPDARYPFAVVEKAVREFTPPPPKPELDPHMAAGEAVRDGDFDALIELIQVLAGADEDRREGSHVA